MVRGSIVEVNLKENSMIEGICIAVDANEIHPIPSLYFQGQRKRLSEQKKLCHSATKCLSANLAAGQRLRCKYKRIITVVRPVNGYYSLLRNLARLDSSVTVKLSDFLVVIEQ